MAAFMKIRSLNYLIWYRTTDPSCSKNEIKVSARKNDSVSESTFDDPGLTF